MLDEQEKTLSKGSSAYLLASVGAGASRQCCDATQTGRVLHLEDLKSWTRHTWFRRGVTEEIGRYVEGRNRAGVISIAEHIEQSREHPDIESGGSIVEAAPAAVSGGVS